uniref:Uncharacterized protein orf139 n=2 Tax=Xanthomonas hortorum TaxID=56454 RepID=Q5BMW1_9XANT|nr:hypothetical protein [Xanthomonas campestris pv. vitians]
MSNSKVTPRELMFSAISFALFLIGLAVSEYVRLKLPEPFYRFAAGFVIGTMASFAFAAFISVATRVWRGGSAAIDSNKWTRPFTWIFYLLVFLFGLISWYVSWQGKATGIWYGIGFFVAYVLMDLGAGPIIRHDKRGS